MLTRPQYSAGFKEMYCDADIEGRLLHIHSSPKQDAAPATSDRQLPGPEQQPLQGRAPLPCDSLHGCKGSAALVTWPNCTEPADSQSNVVLAMLLP